MTKRLVLVDGSSYLYRAFHALPPLTNSRGEPTGAVYGVASMLRKLRQDYASDYFAVVFDAKGKTFRDEIFPEYKANRPPMPTDLVQQIEPLHALIKALGLPLLIEDGVEADDVIGTLAHQATQQGIDVVVSTGDKDFAQMVNQHVRLINTMSGVELDREGVIKKFGVPPERIVDYLALMGDSVDNIPGVPKCGPKTAAKWLQEYDSLDNLCKKANEIKGKIGESLRATLDKLPLSYTLATIKTDVSLKHSIQDLVIQSEHQEQLLELLSRLEFKTWLKELLNTQPKKEQSAPVYDLILTQAAFDEWMNKLEQADVFAFDTETTSLSAIDAELVGLSFSVAENKAAYVPVAHHYEGAPQQLSREAVLKRLKPLLQSPKKTKVLHNLKYDFTVLNNYNLEILPPFNDTMLESYILDPSGSRHDLDTLALKYLHKSNIKYEEVTGRGAKQIGFAEVKLEEAGPYAAEDADVCFQLHHILSKKFAELPGQNKVLHEIDLPLVPVLSRMERIGILISKDTLDHQAIELNARLAKVQAEIYILAGEEFNIDSPKQLQVILYEKLGLPVLAKTPTGQASTAEAVLSDLALQYDLPARIVEYRSLAKLLSTYVEKLPQQINSKTGRVHTSFHQAVTTTGRLSSSDPNLQNIPIRTEEGRRIREAFIAPEGSVMLAADYSQIELRIMAHLSDDPGLLKAFSEGLDVHRFTASEVFSVDPEDVTDGQRRHAKAINFGLMYGMSSFGLARQLGISRQEADKYVAIYFERYPGVKAYMERTRALAHKQGFVETIFGRRLYLPEIKSAAHPRRMAAERAAINAPLQGTSADIIKRAMIAVDHALIQSASKAHLVLQVHDELVLEVPQSELETIKAMLVDCMTHAAKLHVPLEVSVGSGPHWGAAH